MRLPVCPRLGRCRAGRARRRSRYQEYDYPGDAATALARLDAVYAAWNAGVRGLDADGLARPCGPAEGLYAHAAMASLVMHINREAGHHGAEVALLRDLFRWQPARA